jgi:hypothetical protein
MDREIDPQRHKQRLVEDPAYRAHFPDLERPVRNMPEFVEPVVEPTTRNSDKTIRIAIVIPTYSVPSPQNWCSMAASNAAGWKEQCHDLIISEDGEYCPQLHEIADVYILHPRYWTAENANIGWQLALARGADYVALMDSDVVFHGGSLKELCIPNQITVPTVAQHPDQVSVAPMLVVPKEVTAQIGIYDSAGGKHGLYWFDNNFQARITAAKIPLERSKSLIISHEGGATTRFLHPDDRPKGSPIS